MFFFILLLGTVCGLELKEWLKRLDDRISKSLVKGTGNGIDLLQRVTMYNGYLYHLCNTDQEWNCDVPRKMIKVEKLKKKCWLGPTFLKVNYTLGTLKGKLKINDNEIKELELLIEETKCLFAEVEEQGVVKRVTEMQSEESVHC